MADHGPTEVAPRRRPARFATSKFCPAAPGTAAVTRAHALARLDQAADLPLRLVLGSPGAGKTSVLAQRAASLPPGTVAWLNVDSGDRDPLRFWQAVIAAIAQVRPGFGAAAVDLLMLDQAVEADALEAFLDDAERLPTPIDLVVDDFHAAGAASHEHLRFLLGRGFGALRLTIGSRSEPDLGLDRLRLTGQLCELRDADLRFDRPEAAALLATLAVDLEPAELDAVMARTEGWPAGLQLAGVTLQSSADPAAFIDRLRHSTQVISHYLTSEVFATQTAEMQRFLLDTCVTEDLTADLAAALSPESPVGLADVEAANLLLVRVDPAGTVFRYHHLLAEMLRLRLRANDPGHETVLHQRATEWYAARGDHAAAFRHRWRAGRKSEAMHHLHDTLVDSYMSGRLPGLGETDLALTDGDLRDAAAAAASLGLALFLGGRMDEGRRLLHRVAAVGGLYLDDLERIQLAASLAVMALADGRFDAAVAEAGHARDLGRQLGVRTQWTDIALEVAVRALGWVDRCDEAHDLAAELAGEFGEERHDHLGAVELSGAVAQLRLMQGRYADVVRLSAPIGARLAGDGLTGIAVDLPWRAAFGCALLEQGQLDLAEEQLSFVHHREVGVRLPANVLAKVGLSRVWRAEGHFDAAAGLLDEADDITRRTPPDGPLRDHVRVQRVRLALDLGDLDGAESTLRQMGDTTERAMCHARVLLARGEIDAARTALDAAGQPSTDRQRLDRAVLAVALAVSAELPVDAPAAIALDLAAPHGAMHCFAEAGAAVLDAVRRVARSRPLDPYLTSLLAQPPLPVAADRPEVHYHADALSERERTVLRYLATSLSYREIAAELYVSVNTLKTHVKAVIRKLHADSRAEAIERARHLRYL